MAIEDKIKWNKKYKDTPKLLQQREVGEKLILAINKAKGKKALDIASGAGKNSIYLAKNGFNVEALDISELALESLKEQNYENITCILVDLDNYDIPKNSYDLIVMTNFLDRKLIPKLSKALKKDGILFIETYMEDKENEKEPSNPDFLLKKDELKTFFNDRYEVLDYDEFFNESYELFRMKKESIIIRKK